MHKERLHHLRREGGESLGQAWQAWPELPPAHDAEILDGDFIFAQPLDELLSFRNWGWAQDKHAGLEETAIESSREADELPLRPAHF